MVDQQLFREFDVFSEKSLIFYVDFFILYMFKNYHQDHL